MEQILVGHQNNHWCEKFSFSCKNGPQKQNKEIKQEFDFVWFENNNLKLDQSLKEINFNLPNQDMDVAEFVWFEDVQKIGSFTQFKENHKVNQEENNIRDDEEKEKQQKKFVGSTWNSVKNFLDLIFE